MAVLLAAASGVRTWAVQKPDSEFAAETGAGANLDQRVFCVPLTLGDEVQACSTEQPLVTIATRLVEIDPKLGSGPSDDAGIIGIGDPTDFRLRKKRTSEFVETAAVQLDVDDGTVVIGQCSLMASKCRHYCKEDDHCCDK